MVGLVLTAAPTAQESVWVWNPQCVRPLKVALRVRLDGHTLYATTLPLCRWGRQFEKGTASFRFTPRRPLVWYGYRSDEGHGTKDPGDTTPAGTTLEVEFWQAGGESGDIEMGYTVGASDGLHMNAVHFVSPTGKRTSTMAPGLVVETWPEQRR